MRIFPNSSGSVAVGGFTVVEMLVVVGIISVLASVIYFSGQEGSAQSRDAERQADLRNLETALELYKNRYGRYPQGCNGAGSWSGQVGTQYDCPDEDPSYIVGLAPEFIRTLPSDPRPNGDDSGYVYLTNADGTAYKLYVWRSVEQESVDQDHPFVSCDIYGLCSDVYYAGNGLPSWCQSTNNDFQSSYAVWGGYADGFNDAFIRRNTQDIVCQRPTP